MADLYRVVAPYVTFKILNPVDNKLNVVGLNEGGIISSDQADDDSIAHLLRKGLIEEYDDSEQAEQAEAAEEADFAEVMAGNADGVKSWVADDSDRARQALEAETSADGKNRSTLVAHLEEVASRPADDDND